MEDFFEKLVKFIKGVGETVDALTVLMTKLSKLLWAVGSVVALYAYLTNR